MLYFAPLWASSPPSLGDCPAPLPRFFSAPKPEGCALTAQPSGFFAPMPQVRPRAFSPANFPPPQATTARYPTASPFRPPLPARTLRLAAASSPPLPRLLAGLRRALGRRQASSPDARVGAPPLGSEASQVAPKLLPGRESSSTKPLTSVYLVGNFSLPYRRLKSTVS